MAIMRMLSPHGAIRLGGAGVTIRGIGITDGVGTSVGVDSVSDGVGVTRGITTITIPIGAIILTITIIMVPFGPEAVT